MRVVTASVSAVLLVLSSFVANGADGVGVSGLFTEHMVIQHGMKVPVWGTAAPGEKVTVRLADDTETATADAHGKWKVWFGPLKPGGPHSLTIAGAGNTVVVNDVLVGEVWFCSGQSNMQWPVKQCLEAEAEMAAANHPRLRFFNVPLIVAAEPQETCGGQWRVCSPESVAGFSGTAYFFGRDLQKALDMPVGLIDCSSGGRPIESYMSRATLAADPGFRPILDFWEGVCATGPARKAAYDLEMAQWREAAAAARAAGKPEPQEPYPPLGRGHWNEPGGLYNGSVHPVAPYGIRGALWYQGESNTDRAAQYERLLPAMIREWRRLWGQGDFPFLYVQLPNYGKRTPEPQPESRWAEFREAQRQALAERHTGMITAIDLGDPDDIHPRNKQSVGARLAALALAKVYGKDVAGSGPLYKAMTVKDGKVRLRFDAADGALVVGGSGGGEEGLRGFIIAGPDRKFVWAKAAITGKNAVTVWADEVRVPAAVRYAWADDPAANLYNAAGLPASPFRTDTWPLESEGRTVTTFEFLGATPAQPPGGTPR